VEHTDLIMILGEIKSDVKKLLKEDESKEKRLSRLERYSWMIAGAAGSVGAVFPSAIAKAFGWH
jgi:H+/Cl- antiporter ClcA